MFWSVTLFCSPILFYFVAILFMDPILFILLFLPSLRAIDVLDIDYEPWGSSPTGAFKVSDT